MKNSKEIMNPVCINCGRNLIPGGCDGCLAEIVYEMAQEIENRQEKEKEQLREKERGCIGWEFREKYLKSMLRKRR